MKKEVINLIEVLPLMQHPVKYLLWTGAFSVIIRLIQALLKSFQWQYRSSSIWSDFWVNIKGFNLGEDSDYWYPFFLGWIEFFCYPILIVTNNWTFIGAWLGFKTIAQWEVWSDNRSTFNRFLIGNALVLIVSLWVASRLLRSLPAM